MEAGAAGEMGGVEGELAGEELEDFGAAGGVWDVLADMGAEVVVELGEQDEAVGDGGGADIAQGGGEQGGSAGRDADEQRVAADGGEAGEIAGGADGGGGEVVDIGSGDEDAPGVAVGGGGGVGGGVVGGDEAEGDAGEVVGVVLAGDAADGGGEFVGEDGGQAADVGGAGIQE